MSDIMPKNSVLIEPSGLMSTAWIAGAESGVPYKAILDSADWRPFAPTYEDQTRPKFDAVSCVTYSGLNTLEAQLERMRILGQLPPFVAQFLEDKKYLDANGKLNFSDRFSAIKSGTTPNGNYMSNAPDSFRNDGLIPEVMLPFPEDIAALAPSIGQLATVQKYLDPSCITPNMEAVGKAFLDLFDIRYENIWYGRFQSPDLDLIKHHLKQAPLHFAAAVCSGENTQDVIPNCGCGSSHARAIFAVDDAVRIFDSFYRANKSLAKDFCIPYLYKIVITVKTDLPAPIPVTHKFTKSLVPEVLRAKDPSIPSNDGDEVMALQRALQYLKNTVTGKPYLSTSIIPVPVFGPLTTAAVIAFQTDRKAATAGEIRIAQGRVGPKTRTALNAALGVNK